MEFFKWLTGNIDLIQKLFMLIESSTIKKILINKVRVINGEQQKLPAINLKTHILLTINISVYKGHTYDL